MVEMKMIMMAVMSLVASPAMAESSSSTKKFGCGSPSDEGDCKALLSFAIATSYTKWKDASGWGESSKSVCEWHGITCENERVVSIDLKENGLEGTIPDSIRLLTELRNLSLQGGRPSNYVGCSGNNFKNSSLPNGFFTLTKLQYIDLEYTCLGGTLNGFGNLTSLLSLQLHGNYISGSIPQDLEKLTEIVVLKLGRNPISGQLPLFTTLKKAVQFNCNFCALSGTFPDMFGYFDSLEVSYWDGNGFSGRLPPSIATAKKLTRVSFNINSFSGDIPAGICQIPAGDGGDTPDTAHDCRIGADTNLSVYQADKYPWILPAKGNVYNCQSIPMCARVGSCNKTHGVAVVNPLSPVRCH